MIEANRSYWRPKRKKKLKTYTNICELIKTKKHKFYVVYSKETTEVDARPQAINTHKFLPTTPYPNAQEKKNH